MLDQLHVRIDRGKPMACAPFSATRPSASGEPGPRELRARVLDSFAAARIRVIFGPVHKAVSARLPGTVRLTACPRLAPSSASRESDRTTLKDEGDIVAPHFGPRNEALRTAEARASVPRLMVESGCPLRLRRTARRPPPIALSARWRAAVDVLEAAAQHLSREIP